jgi:hypothetical protein
MLSAATATLVNVNGRLFFLVHKWMSIKNVLGLQFLVITQHSREGGRSPTTTGLSRSHTTPLCNVICACVEDRETGIKRGRALLAWDSYAKGEG